MSRHEDFDSAPLETLTRLPIDLEFIGQHIPEYIPEYSTSGSSGVDLRADIEHPVDVKFGEVVTIPTGIKLNIPEDYEGQVRSRSGLAMKQGVFVVNSPGTIDSDYTGELKIILSRTKEGMYTVEPGERIAQIVFAPVTQVLFNVTEIENNESRGEKGFGSTGTH